MKYFIISQPKAGTYLCANLLQEFNLLFEGYHINPKSYQKYNFNDLIRCRETPENFTHHVPIQTSINLIKENHFGVGHLIPSEENINLLKNFKKILITRDIESIQTSYQKWVTESFKVRKIMPVKKILSILNWKDKNNVFSLSFDDLKNKNHKKNK